MFYNRKTNIQLLFLIFIFIFICEDVYSRNTHENNYCGLGQVNNSIEKGLSLSLKKALKAPCNLKGIELLGYIKKKKISIDSDDIEKAIKKYLYLRMNYNLKNRFKYVNELVDLARKGDFFGNLIVGNMLVDGSLISKSYKEAYPFLEKASAKGSNYALGRMAIMKIFGLGIEKSTKEGMEMLVKAADGGDVISSFNLGIEYFKAKDYKRAYHYFKFASNNEHAKASYNLYLMRNKKLLEINDPISGKEYLKKASMLGYSVAQRVLALSLLKNSVNEVEIKEGVRLLKESIKQGDADSMYALALYKSKNSSCISTEKLKNILKLLRESERLGNPDAHEFIQNINEYIGRKTMMGCAAE